jgi:hypothetical protein
MTDNEKKLKKILSEPKLFIESFVKIVNKDGKLVPFILNPQQKELLENLSKFNVVLKSRQLGITSVALALSLYYAVVEPNSTILFVSYSLQSANGIFERLKTMYRTLPDAIKPKLNNNNRQELSFQNNSRIIVSSMGNKDIGRGLFIRFCHISEMAFANQNNVSKQLLSIEQSLTAKAPILIESTGNGFNQFSEIYMNAEKGQNLYKNFFFSWIDDKLMFKEEYEMFAKRWVENNGSLPKIEELSEIEKSLIEQGANIKQIVWRRLKILNSSPEEFSQEFP